MPREEEDLEDLVERKRDGACERREKEEKIAFFNLERERIRICEIFCPKTI
jgi:hypothetical protein